MNITKPLTILSFGGGQDSSAILFRLMSDRKEFDRLIRGDLWIIMSDTGNEHPETYVWVEKVRKICEKKKIDFSFLRARSQMHSRSWPSLTGQWIRNSNVGTKSFRKSCTDKLKIGPIYNLVDYIIQGKVSRKQGLYEHLEKFGKMRVMIGIAKGEESRVSKGDKDPIWMQKTIEKVYPLIEWGWDRKACQDFLGKVKLTGGEIPLPSNCMFCPFQSDIEVLWLWKKYPDKFLEWVEIEAKKLQKWASMGAKNSAVFGSRDLFKVLEDAKKKYAHLSDAEIHEYKMSHGHCVKSKY